MTTVTVGKDDYKLILTYDFESLEDNKLVFTGNDIRVPSCEFIVMELNVNLTSLNWLK